MMETKFTPAPWTADLRGGCCAIYPSSHRDDTQCCSSNDLRNICYSRKDAYYNGNHWEMCKETQANFVLMAAAPKLYEALEGMIAYCHKLENKLLANHLTVTDIENDCERYAEDVAECALAEARGETNE